MSAAADIEQAIAELERANTELKALIQVEKTVAMVRALETIEDRIHEALTKLGG